MSHCPSRDTLESLLAGRLAEAELSAAADHVDGCASCQAALESLAEPSELSELRPRGAARVDGPPAPAPGLMRVLADIRDGSTPPLIVADTAEDRSDGASAAQPVLDPPRRDGDLGALDSYLVRREIGRGGMGIVFEAFDPELNRPVAIKMLRPERTDARSRARFVREAQAAARLKHEHIVTVYSVVNPPDVPPYFVMEFIAGPTLRECIDREKRLEPRHAAQLCVQIADGLAAAHAAGLVHRDVKPSNVLLEEGSRESAVGSREGPRATAPARITHPSLLPIPDSRLPSAKLTDFGLARLTSLPPGSTLTQEGMVAGTPTYMSPEQVREPDRTDARSDVYSLGVTLYETLTGDVPFHGEPHMVLRQVEFDEPPPPRRLNDVVPVDLETICLKAMAKEPERRYQSARELADDLRRWLGGEPIHARPAGSVERLRLWARRNPRVASLTAAVFGLLLTLAVGSSVAAVWISREQARTEQRRVAAVQAGEEAKRNAEEAQRAHRREAAQAQLARDAADAARAAEEKARSLAKAASDGRSVAMDSLSALIVKVMDRLGDTAGTIKLREELVQTAIDGLERVSQNAEKDASVDRNIMLTHQRLGLIYIDAGRTGEAIAQFQRSQELVNGLLRDNQGNAILQRDLARALGKLGDLAFHNHDDAAALENYRQALAIYESQHASDPDNVPARDGLNVTYNNLARLLERQGDLPGARQWAEKSLAIIESLAASQPDTRFRRGLVITLGRLGAIDERRADFEAATRHYRRQVEITEQLVASEPENATLLSDLSVVYGNLGSVQFRQWEFREAESLYRKALELQETRAAKDVENAVAQQQLASANATLGDVQTHLDATAARESFRRAVAIAEAQARRDPTSAQRVVEAIEHCSKLAQLEARADSYAEAVTWTQRAQGILDRFIVATGELTTPQLIGWRATARDEFEAYRAAARGLDDNDTTAGDASEAVHARLARLRAVSLARRGRHEAASLAAQKLRKRQAGTPEDLAAAAAATYALCVQAVERLRSDARGGQAGLSAERSALRDNYAASAIETLRQLFQSQPATLSTEHSIPEFDPLRRMPEYRALVDELRKGTRAAD